jgi:hypothetical protein
MEHRATCSWDVPHEHHDSLAQKVAHWFLLVKRGKEEI